MPHRNAPLSETGRLRLAHPARLDRATGRVARRYEHERRASWYDA